MPNSMNNLNASRDAMFEPRAPPRKRKEDPSEAPIFLKKAYAMFESISDEIGGWSAQGDSFVIKDVNAFAEQMIPVYYKHKNFTSFVRQLNFYGFRKVKASSIRGNPNW